MGFVLLCIKWFDSSKWPRVGVNGDLFLNFLVCEWSIYIQVLLLEFSFLTSNERSLSWQRKRHRFSFIWRFVEILGGNGLRFLLFLEPTELQRRDSRFDLGILLFCIFRKWVLDIWTPIKGFLIRLGYFVVSHLQKVGFRYWFSVK